VAVVTPKLAEEKSELVRRVAQTLGAANDMFHTKFGETVDILKKKFPRIPPLAIERRSNGPVMAIKGWPDDHSDVENNIKVALALGMISSAPSAKEGELWTNKFQS
jgi:hypothetical protein